jgi:3-hydroxy acid dehydrogenase / malonic semialdehyde reductase
MISGKLIKSQVESRKRNNLHISLIAGVKKKRVPFQNQISIIPHSLTFTALLCIFLLLMYFHRTYIYSWTNMTTLKNDLVFITGASSGIGRSCAYKFAEAGARLILIARRKERLEKLAAELKKQFKTESYIDALDIRDRHTVTKFAQKLPVEWQDIDILINNAGLSRGLQKIHEGQFEDWEEMIDTNIKGLLYVSHNVLPGMVQRRKGTVINIGSIAGHDVYPGGNVYCATKHAVDALTKGMRMDLVDTPIRVCTIDPGLVETEFSEVRFHGDKERAKKTYENMTPLTPDDIADAVFFAATRPAHVQITELIIMPTAQATATLVHRTPPS